MTDRKILTNYNITFCGWMYLLQIIKQINISLYFWQLTQFHSFQYFALQKDYLERFLCISVTVRTGIQLDIWALSRYSLGEV
jgi:hypothetical protein